MQKMTIDNGLAFLESNRSYIESKVYEKKYNKITYADLIPVSNEAGEWAESITYYTMDTAGAAKWIGDKSFDVPLAEVSTGKVSVPVRMGGVGYGYSLEELGTAQMVGRPLTEMKASGARRASEEFIQNVAMTGDADVGFEGFINNSNVPTGNATNGTWSTATAAEILQDINDLFSSVNEDTNDNEMADTLVLPIAQWNLIMSTPRSADSDTTIAQYVVANSPFISSLDRIKKITELKGAGVGATDRMMVYTNDPDKVVFHVPMPYKFLPTQPKGLGFEVPGMFRVASVEFRYPLSAAYSDGI